MCYKQWSFLTGAPDYPASDDQVLGSVHSRMFSKAGRHTIILELEHHNPSLQNIMITQTPEVYFQLKPASVSWYNKYTQINYIYTKNVKTKPPIIISL